MAKKMTKEEFIIKAKEIHGDKYDYSKVEYKNTKTKVCIICPEHGEFWMRPCDHLNRKYGCHICGWKKEAAEATRTKEDFIKLAHEKFGDKYDYTKVNYVNSRTKVCIISHEKDAYGVEIGEFWQTPANHLSYGMGNVLRNSDTKRFVERAKLIHGDFYDYSKTVYKDSDKKVIITCPLHGDFEQLPYNHLNGQGCRFCKSKSVLEKQVKLWLEKEGLSFITQQRFSWLGKKSLDFYLPDLNIAIECQGRQHFYRSSKWEELDIVIKRDKEKQQQCKDHNIEILYVINKKYRVKSADIYNDKNLIHIKDLGKIIKKEDEK